MRKHCDRYVSLYTGVAALSANGGWEIKELTTANSTRYRPGGGETICPPPMAVRRWHIVSPSIRPSASVRGSKKSPRIYVRPRTGPQSAHLWWLSCRQPACRMSIAYRAAAPRDRRADRAVPKCPLGRGIIRWSVSPANVQTVQSIAAVAPTF